MPSKREIHIHGGRFIDPIDCGSTVAWVVDVTVSPPQPDHAREYERDGRVTLSASISLSDCNRRIEWDMSGNRDCTALQKIDAAIAELQDFRAALATATNHVKIKRAEFGMKPRDDDED
jgi:hypothetical protein